jgi:hypothetical protein
MRARAVDVDLQSPRTRAYKCRHGGTCTHACTEAHAHTRVLVAAGADRVAACLAARYANAHPPPHQVRPPPIPCTQACTRARSLYCMAPLAFASMLTLMHTCVYALACLRPRALIARMSPLVQEATRMVVCTTCDRRTTFTPAVHTGVLADTSSSGSEHKPSSSGSTALARQLPERVMRADGMYRSAC